MILNVRQFTTPLMIFMAMALHPHPPRGMVDYTDE